MNNAIECAGLGKRYYLNQTVGHTIGRLLGTATRERQEFWALKDLNFTVTEGESVGLIGPNGAGKSTLLKILSNVTKPTHGTLRIHGKVGALIEVGAGFHPELTGRENIFMNGAILGLTKREIESKFDEIVAFSELDQFIDTPVKRYSSGMFVRLGFSVAAHIFPDILLIDEILAVGDHRFQLKCFEWVKTFLRSGQTFFLVSHNMHHIESVCKRVLYVRKGQIAFDGPPEVGISRYMSDLARTDDDGSGHTIGRKIKVTEFDVVAVRLVDHNGNVTDTIEIGAPFSVQLDYKAPTKVVRPKIEISVKCGTLCVGQANTVSDRCSPEALIGEGTVTFTMSACLFSPNRYSVDLFVADGETMADILALEQALFFNVISPAGFKIASGAPGFVKIPGTWSA